MSSVVDSLDAPSSYRDSRNTSSRAATYMALSKTATLYVGNLSFYTTEEQMHELFGRVCNASSGGGIRRIIMGLDRINKTPCGFAFVEYYTHAEALACMRQISGTKLDERVIRCDLDPGYTDGRQYGRGRSGGQVRDEYRQEYDAGRGGWGHLRLKEEEDRIAKEEERRKEHDEVYKEQEEQAGGRVIPAGAEEVYEELEGRQRAGNDATGSDAPGEHDTKRKRADEQSADGDSGDESFARKRRLESPDL
ncbi:putative nuclear cap binding protein subunit 2 [Ceraceosorus guamensis]|uniref:Nuclear cap-binding protein subunit 2 n=1 Tax=Ceraceosorus guamensis TaxID=1522189 RepID=A0A316VSE2_9BASI|nr:putative nuclear cap binding protein subunit 2 [Ceraceosorus guamensis]PWN40134.1 putative nuclear cap binding protein subunit 2 [Ceraceosorus guamensis]